MLGLFVPHALTVYVYAPPTWISITPDPVIRWLVPPFAVLNNTSLFGTNVPVLSNNAKLTGGTPEDAGSVINNVLTL